MEELAKVEQPVEAELVDESLPTCGICSTHKDCANCIDSYGRNIDCGWPICRECRDEGPPKGAKIPEGSWDKIFNEGMDPSAMMARSIRNMLIGTFGTWDDDDE
jgi:hypothetical protein